MDSSGPSRRPCFIEEDDGLASLADMEAGYSGSHYHSPKQNGFFSRPLCYSRRSSLRNLSSSVSSPRSARFYDARFEDHQPHFLDACFLCKKPLGGNRDIFMYRSMELRLADAGYKNKILPEQVNKFLFQFSTKGL
ncbi:Zf-FLZ domain - like 5 [Theobroma cacao]|nr:Zf-FLZ domain - like 5 [Theobroma cacao]